MAQETTDEVPDWAKVWLDPDVAQWLHEQADAYYGGDVGAALNTSLRTMMIQLTSPDRWEAVGYQRRERWRASYPWSTKR